jgi:hypothetical protein
MKIHRSISTSLALLSLAGLSLKAAELTRYDARGGSKMRIEGTSVIHDWRAESPLVRGFLEVGPGFPTEPGQTATPGKMDARSEVIIPVTSLVPLKSNGTPEDPKMSETMYKMLKQTNYPAIVFRLSELTLKESPKAKDAPYIFDSKGDLAVAGVTNKLAMVVNVFPLADKKLKITGTTPLKMTDFKIEPATFIIPAFKTSEDITIKFEWMLGQRKPAAAAAAK